MSKLDFSSNNNNNTNHNSDEIESLNQEISKLKTEIKKLNKEILDKRRKEEELSTSKTLLESELDNVNNN